MASICAVMPAEPLPPFVDAADGDAPTADAAADFSSVNEATFLSTLLLGDALQEEAVMLLPFVGAIVVVTAGINSVSMGVIEEAGEEVMIVPLPLPLPPLAAFEASSYG